MGRQRLIVQADLTSEEDQAFLAWVKAKLRRRRLAEEIRAGLRLQYERSTGQGASAYASYQEQLGPQESLALLRSTGQEQPGIKLQRLVQDF